MDLFLVKHHVFLPIFFKNVDFSISDYSLSIVLMPLLVFASFFFAMRKAAYYPKIMQNAAELAYEKFHKIFDSYLGAAGAKYIPFLFSLMLFIFVLNIGNLIPGFFPCTGQLTLTLVLGITVFLLVTIIGFMAHKWHFWAFFIPAGVPGILKPLLFVLEVFSFCIRPLSLALRLAINMLAGHVMLHVVASFSPHFNTISIASIAISAILSIFEICVAGLQAYVFAVLSCIYIADVTHGHE